VRGHEGPGDDRWHGDRAPGRVPLHLGRLEPERQILVPAGGKGSWIELLVGDGGSGPKRLTLHGTKSYDYGFVRFLVNGKEAGKEFDGFAPEPILTGPIDLGAHEPSGGKIVLRVDGVGANPASRGPKHDFGLDCVVVEQRL
jgi:hypothetical protein